MPLFDPQLLLDLLQRYTLRLRNHRFHPNQLENHHAGKERENVSGREGRDHPREERCEQRGEDPVREAAQRLTLRAMTIGKYLRNKHPNDGALADCVGSDEGEDAHRHDREMIAEKGPGHEAERGDVAERTDV